MLRLILDETHLERLSPASRREVLSLIADDVRQAQKSYVERDWNPDGDHSFPLSVEEARLLVAGMPEHATAVINLFVDNFDGERCAATLAELQASTGHTNAENVGKLISWIQHRVTTVTGDQDAWLVNWRTEDWIWDEDNERYTDGIYFIDTSAALALREALQAG